MYSTPVIYKPESDIALHTLYCIALLAVKELNRVHQANRSFFEVIHCDLRAWDNNT